MLSRQGRTRRGGQGRSSFRRVMVGRKILRVFLCISDLVSKTPGPCHRRFILTLEEAPIDWIALTNQLFGQTDITFSEPSDRDFSAMEPCLAFFACEQRDRSLIHLSLSFSRQKPPPPKDTSQMGHQGGGGGGWDSQFALKHPKKARLRREG